MPTKLAVSTLKRTSNLEPHFNVLPLPATPPPSTERIHRRLSGQTAYREER